MRVWHGSEDKISSAFSDERMINNYRASVVLVVQRVNSRVGVRHQNDRTIFAPGLIDEAQASHSRREHFTAAMSDYVKHSSLTCTTDVGETWQVLSKAAHLRRKALDHLRTEQVKNDR